MASAVFDGLPPPLGEEFRDVNGSPLNPVNA